MESLSTQHLSSQSDGQDGGRSGTDRKLCVPLQRSRRSWWQAVWMDPAELNRSQCCRAGQRRFLIPCSQYPEGPRPAVAVQYNENIHYQSFQLHQTQPCSLGTTQRRRDCCVLWSDERTVSAAVLNQELPPKFGGPFLFLCFFHRFLSFFLLLFYMFVFISPFIFLCIYYYLFIHKFRFPPLSNPSSVSLLLIHSTIPSLLL